MHHHAQLSLAGMKHIHTKKGRKSEGKKEKLNFTILPGAAPRIPKSCAGNPALNTEKFLSITARRLTL
jgi:hypothetical protein